MLNIDCPNCGPRDESEFRYGGEAHIKRPGPPEALSDEDWADYLFMRTNPKGLFCERWMHLHGCRKWFHAVRNTATDAFAAIYPIDQAAPALDALRVPEAQPTTPAGEPAIGSGASALAADSNAEEGVAP